jgi:hypothetical protein
MKKELEQNLVIRYPLIFRDYLGDMRKTCMAWGFECGDGWYNLLIELCEKIECLTEGTSLQVVAVQVKEKFGGLRFYYLLEDSSHVSNVDRKVRSKIFWRTRGFFVKMNLWRLFDWINEQRQKVYKTIEERISDVVDDAEAKSYKTCEICGESGTANSKGWITTLCQSCRDSKRRV